MATLHPSVQLYTLRDQVQSDFPAVLSAVKEIGYRGAELAGYGSLGSAEAVKNAFDAAGLVVSGAHVSIDAFEKDAAAALRDQKTLGNTEVIVPWLDESRRKTAADWRKFAGQMTEIGNRVAGEGMRLSYHNHSFEFETFDGQTGMQIFLDHADPTVVGIELDVFWVKHGGLDPASYIKSLGSRLRLVHLKDMTADRKFAPVGTGTLNFNEIVQAAATAGVRWGVVEQDDCYGGNPIDSVRTSYNNLKQLGLF